MLRIRAAQPAWSGCLCEAEALGPKEVASGHGVCGPDMPSGWDKPSVSASRAHELFALLALLPFPAGEGLLDDLYFLASLLESGLSARSVEQAHWVLHLALEQGMRSPTWLTQRVMALKHLFDSCIVQAVGNGCGSPTWPYLRNVRPESGRL